MAHSPGPWELGEFVHVDEEGNEAGQFISNEDDTIAYIDCPNEANVHLMVAAPELLEALELFMAEVDSPYPNSKHVVRKAKAAIAKAKG